MTLNELIEINEKLKREEITYDEWLNLAFDFDVPEEPNFDAVDDRQGEEEAAYLADQEARQQIEEIE